MPIMNLSDPLQRANVERAQAVKEAGSLPERIGKAVEMGLGEYGKDGEVLVWVGLLVAVFLVCYAAVNWYRKIRYAVLSERAEGKLGYRWWKAYGILGLTLGNLIVLSHFSSYEPLLAFFAVALRSLLSIMILKRNRYAFLLSTLLTMNPLAWIVNGIYLKNRWDDLKN